MFACIKSDLLVSETLSGGVNDVRNSVTAGKNMTSREIENKLSETRVHEESEANVAISANDQDPVTRNTNNLERTTGRLHNPHKLVYT